MLRLSAALRIQFITFRVAVCAEIEDERLPTLVSHVVSAPRGHIYSSSGKRQLGWGIPYNRISTRRSASLPTPSVFDNDKKSAARPYAAFNPNFLRHTPYTHRTHKRAIENCEQNNQITSRYTMEREGREGTPATITQRHPSKHEVLRWGGYSYVHDVF